MRKVSLPQLAHVSWRCLLHHITALPKDCKLRRVKYLNNIIEQDNRFIKKRARACLGYRSFDTAERTLQGVEAMNMIRKGQVKRLHRNDVIEQAKFIASLFQVAA
jgi:transposase, IS6 family